MEEQLTDPADRVLAIIDHLERSGEAEMAADIRALHIEAEQLRALAATHVSASGNC
jgi:hypothetical protein